MYTTHTKTTLRPLYRSTYVSRCPKLRIEDFVGAKFYCLHDADANMILTAPLPDNWKRPPGRPRITCDLRAYNFTLNKAL